MTRAVALLLVMLLGGGAMCRAQQTRPLPPPRTIDDDEDADRADRKKTDRTNAKNNVQRKVVPILYPLNPFPPPAHPVRDPRTHAWQQVRCAAPPVGPVLPLSNVHPGVPEGQASNRGSHDAVIRAPGR